MTGKPKNGFTQRLHALGKFFFHVIHWVLLSCYPGWLFISNKKTGMKHHIHTGLLYINYKKIYGAIMLIVGSFSIFVFGIVDQFNDGRPG